ncbi:response regulator transcription factor [Marinimicrobium sp. ABcell2]|uniref:response regulator transcription factor n=1 Tax=Marinimicrobium sp. ABcell2 TaxID=3069751 RepID=UPI0027B83CE1|nr:response regulator transcription factor [Marinimicrobium sp. ABcell2]MDQ2076288.1 response regulator transcription factor [Marinimicrobium sp. ABcell2]
MRILVVEDELALREQIQSLLSADQYASDLAADGREGLFLGQEYDYDLAIIDLGLPLLDGVSLIRQLREERRHYPILVLTARGAWQDKVEGLEAGADDYLTKPFHPAELRARINALLRRASGHATPVMQFGPLTIDTSARRIRLNGEAVELTSYEYNTLVYLALNAGKTVSKTELTEHLYAQDFDRDSNVIEVFIGRLRKKLDPDSSLNLISTQRGMGYRFNLVPEDGSH